MAGDSKFEYKFELLGGTFWFAAWLFTIGFLELTFWQGVFALAVWPYYLGVHFR